MNTKPLSIAAAVLAALAMSACGEKPAEPKGAAPAAAAQEKPAAAAAPAAAQKCKSAEEIRALVKSTDKATPDEYFAVLENYACCPVNQETLSIDDDTCAAEQVRVELREKGKLPGFETVLDRVLAHSAPQVRARGYDALSGNLFGSTESDREAGKKALATETDLFALRALIEGLRNEGNRVPEVGEFLKKMATHEHPALRRVATNALARSHSDKVPGVVEAVIARLGDEDKEVVSIACKGASTLGSDAIVEPIAAILKDASKANIHTECVSALTDLWLDFPKRERTSAAAYKATLDYYKTTPRSQDVPDSGAVSALAGGYSIPRAGTKAASEEKFVAWKKKASYYKPDELAAIMLDIVKDPQANWMARGQAVRVIGDAGGLAALKKIASTVEALNDDKANLIKQGYEKELKKAEEETAAK